MGSHASSSKPAENELRVALDALRQIVRALRLSSTKAEKTRGVSGAQLFVLQILAERPASSIADLASRTVTDASSVSVVVKRLVERGLVARRLSKMDSRRAELALTRKGSALICSAPQVAQTKLIDAFAMLSPSTRRSLSHGLAELVSKMGNASEPAELFFENDDEEASRPRAARPKIGSRHRALS
jgi:DNA-binding MarR family transcriptional regulator